MTTFVVGDVQGCYTALRQLLDQLDFDDRKDRLLLTGDLVNRGPESLQCLRFVRSLGAAATTVLGNHDLHLLAAARSKRFSKQDTLQSILRARDRDELLHWLRQQPLAYSDRASGVLLVHAGVPPQWTREQTLRLARAASKTLQGTSGDAFLDQMYGNEPDRWNPALRGIARTRFVINCLTRLRYVSRDGRINLREKGAPGTQARGLVPWFQAPGRLTKDDTIITGHWSTLGKVRWKSENVWGLDTGCVWGGCLTALNLDTGICSHVSCTQYRKPGVVGD